MRIVLFSLLFSIVTGSVHSKDYFEGVHRGEKGKKDDTAKAGPVTPFDKVPKNLIQYDDGSPWSRDTWEEFIRLILSGKYKKKASNRFTTLTEAEKLRVLAAWKTNPQARIAYEKLLGWHLKEYDFYDKPPLRTTGMEDAFVLTCMSDQFHTQGADKLRIDVARHILKKVDFSIKKINQNHKEPKYAKHLFWLLSGIVKSTRITNRTPVTFVHKNPIPANTLTQLIARRGYNDLSQMFKAIVQFKFFDSQSRTTGQSAIGLILGQVSYNISSLVIEYKFSQDPKKSTKIKTRTQYLGAMMSLGEDAIDHYFDLQEEKFRATAKGGADIIRTALGWIGTVLGFNMAGQALKTVTGYLGNVSSAVDKLEKYESGKEKAPDKSSPIKELKQTLYDTLNMPFSHMIDQRIADDDEVAEQINNFRQDFYRGCERNQGCKDLKIG